LVILGFLALAVSIPAHATDIWTNWTSAAAGENGTAKGSLNGLSVSYSGYVAGNGGDTNLSIAYARTVGSDYPGESTLTWDTSSTGTWDTSSSTTFGGATNAPPTNNNSVPLTGGGPGIACESARYRCVQVGGVSEILEEISFDAAVKDPLIAIWSLGSLSTTASFDFINAQGIEFLSGGADGYIGGQSIVVSGLDVSGQEGSGVIEVLGTFGPGNFLYFTTPDSENYYAFTVGEMTSDVTPEPETLSLFGLGLLALPFLRNAIARRRRA
jgi:hypothetical protein